MQSLASLKLTNWMLGRSIMVRSQNTIQSRHFPSADKLRYRQEIAQFALNTQNSLIEINSVRDILGYILL